MAFDCELVTCSCYLPLLCGLTQSPLPHTKGERVDGGEPIIGQAALIVWLNSWLIEWEMGGRCRVGVRARVRGKKRWWGSIRPWLRAILASTCGVLTQSGMWRALILQGTQLISVSTSLWGSKYTGINTKSFETSIYCITATEIFMWSGPCNLDFPTGCPLTDTQSCVAFQHCIITKGQCCAHITLGDVEELVDISTTT